MSLPKVIIIIGPTAVGKTKLSIELAKKFKTEIISADSMQIYQYMNIGTAKITNEEASGIKHHLIDIIKPNESYSVSKFQNKAFEVINNLVLCNKIPIIVGGSGLYVNSLIYNLDFSNTKSNESIREYYYSIYKDKGADELYSLLEKVDPISAKNIHKNNIKRIIRALEVSELKGQPYSQINNNFRELNNKYDFIIIGLTMEREILYKRINTRVDSMVNEGLFEEVKELLTNGYDKSLISMQGLGYKEVIKYYEGLTTKEETIRLLKRNTRRFAKRQFTWFSKDKRIKWFNITNINNYYTLIQNIYNYILFRLKEDKYDSN